MRHLVFHLAVLIFSIFTFGCGNQSSNGNNEPHTKGQERGNGGDYLPAENASSWFVGESNTITYCVQLAPDFGVNNARANKAIEIAFNKWKEYIDQKQVNVSRDEQSKLPTTWQKSESCNGAQDLTFYFGVTNPDVQRSFKNFVNPVAFAIRTQFDSTTGRGKGFIWLAKLGSVTTDCEEFPECENFPNWQLPYNLEGMLIHEIGHAYGTAHIQWTIMDQDFVHKLKWFPQQQKPEDQNRNLVQIDQLRELVICERCDQEYSGKLGMQWYSKSTYQDPDTGEVVEKEVHIDKSQEVFEYILDRKPNGKIHSSVELNQEGNYILFVSDTLGESSILIEFPEGQTGSVTFDQMAFKTISPFGNNSQSVTWARSGSEQKFGTLTVPNGKTIHISLHRNMFTRFKPPEVQFGIDGIFDSRLIIYYFTNDGQQVLFMNLPEGVL